MISGVITQEPAQLRGALSLLATYLDLETIASPIVAGANNQIISSSGLYVDVDGFSTARFVRILAPSFKVDDSIIFTSRTTGNSQALQPAFYVAVDAFSLPAVALPGILQTHPHAADDAIFAPFISTHGSLRPALFNAFDAIYVPRVVAAQTLLPNRHTDSDTFYAPTRRTGVGPSRVTDNETIYTPSVS